MTFDPAAAPARFILPPPERPRVGRWAAAAVAVLLAHAGFMYWISHKRSEDALAAAPESALMIDLPPLAVGRVDGGGEVSPEPTEAEAAPQPEPVPEPEPVPPEPEPQPEPVPEPPPPPPEPVPDLAPAKKADAVLLAPQKPVVPKKVEPKPKPKHEAKKIVRPPPDAKPGQRDRAASGTAPGRTGGTPGQGGQGGGGLGGGGGSMSGSNWRGLVSARLNAAKRYPAGADGAAGVAVISFSIDRSGNVTSSRLARSSGSAQLDAEAVSLPRRAGPFPPPPPEMGGGSITLTVPVNFRRG